MTCPRCGGPIVQPRTGRRRKWCKDACKVAAHRARVRQAPGLTLANLAERLSAKGEPTTVDRARQLLAGLNPGYVERVGSVWTATPLCLQALGFACSSFVPMSPADDEGMPRLPSGPPKGRRLREMVAA